MGNAIQLQELGLEPHPGKMTPEDWQMEQELDPTIANGSVMQTEKTRSVQSHK